MLKYTCVRSSKKNLPRVCIVGLNLDVPLHVHSASCTQWQLNAKPTHAQEDFNEVAAVAQGVGVLLRDEVLNQAPECAPKLL